MPNSLIAARTIPILRGMLHRGFTTVRDAAGGDIGWRQAIDSGLVASGCKELRGERLLHSGPAAQIGCQILLPPNQIHN
jgi:hypothetical protein